MGRQQMGDIAEKHATRITYMLTGGMEHLIQQQGGRCKGFTIRSAEADTLLIIRAQFPAGIMVAFVGAPTGVHALSQAWRKLRDNSLKWAPCKYSKS